MSGQVEHLVPKFKKSQYYNQPANIWLKALGSEALGSETALTREFDGKSRADDIENPPLPGPGSGTIVAVLSTGIQRNHLAFSNRKIKFDNKVVCKKNFITPGDDDCDDEDGDGTEFAGLACGLTCKGDNLPDDMEFHSNAPGARLMVCKIKRGRSRYESDEKLVKTIRDALNFIIQFNSEKEDNKVDVVLICHVFESFNRDLALAVHEAVVKGIIVVCGASSDGTSISNPIAYPGRLGHVLCIGASDKHGYPLKSSSVGREVDFVELGENIWAPTIGPEDVETTTTMVRKGGTTCASSQVTGHICVLLHKLRNLSPALLKKMHNVWCMRELLKSMTVMQGHHDSAKGYGMLIPKEFFKKGDKEKIRICNEILGN